MYFEEIVTFKKNPICEILQKSSSNVPKLASFNVKLSMNT